MTCALCNPGAELVLWQDAHLRVVYVEEPGYVGYCRVIWQAHVAEMTDLSDTERAHCMNTVFAVETVLRALIQPDKINLASLGNFTPHVHWHVIARFRDDPHFPQAIWGERQRAAGTTRLSPADLPQKLAQALADTLAARSMQRA